MLSCRSDSCTRTIGQKIIESVVSCAFETRRGVGEGLTASSIDGGGGRRLYFVCLGTFASVSEAMEHFHALESHGGVVPCMDRAVDLPGLEEKGHVLYVDGMQHPAFSKSSVDDIVHHNHAHIHERGCERVLELRCKINASR